MLSGGRSGEILLSRRPMEQWQIEMQKGRAQLSRHDAARAIKTLAYALKLCPPEACGCSSEILFYMGISLKRLGYFSSALKLWISAYRIRKQKKIRKMIDRYANGYGMLKQATEELDDRNAFFAVQIRRYLDKKTSRKFTTLAEQDVVFELINDYWKNILLRAIIKGKNIGEKREIFHKIQIPFPYLVMPQHIGDTVFSVNFNSEARVSDQNRCYCGSGLTFAMCCGRTPAVDELLSGVF
jgi:tetratricopeptide (TPR) repeat protein